MSDELTVDSCLEELREMFANCTAEIVTVDSMGFYKPPTHTVEVAFISTDYTINERFKGSTDQLFLIAWPKSVLSNSLTLRGNNCGSSTKSRLPSHSLLHTNC